jgi:predicted kinase
MHEAPAPILIVTGPSGVGKSTVSRLVAAAHEKSAHVRGDDIMLFVVSGWVEPWLPESAHQNEVIGGAMAATAIQFAEGGYTVVLDGHLFPDSLEGLAPACQRRGVPLHYAVLRADLATCLERATSRATGEPPDQTSFAELHGRFMDLGEHEANVVDATGPPDEVAAAVLAAFHSGRVAETVRALGGDA